jgi:hypothetical protein
MLCTVDCKKTGTVRIKLTQVFHSVKPSHDDIFKNYLIGLVKQTIN